MAELMLSTSDNPFNPHSNYDAWWAWDYRAGYHTPEYLARIVRSSDELPEALQAQAIDDAMDEIIRENPLGVYVKVSSED